MWLGVDLRMDTEKASCVKKGWTTLSKFVIYLLNKVYNEKEFQEAYFGPADMVGQFSTVQNSVNVPYKRFT